MPGLTKIVMAMYEKCYSSSGTAAGSKKLGCPAGARLVARYSHVYTLPDRDRLDIDMPVQTGYIFGRVIICMGDQAFEKERRIEDVG